MSNQNHEPKQVRSRSGLTPVAHRPLSGDSNPFAFAHQLVAAQQADAPSSLSRLQALYARFIQCSFIQRGFIQRIQRLGKRLFKRRGRRRKLDIVEIQQLGEKRFVAILRVDKQQFLIAGAATSVSLLAEVDTRRTPALAPRSRGQESA